MSFELYGGQAKQPFRLDEETPEKENAQDNQHRDNDNLYQTHSDFLLETDWRNRLGRLAEHSRGRPIHCQQRDIRATRLNDQALRLVPWKLEDPARVCTKVDSAEKRSLIPAQGAPG